MLQFASGSIASESAASELVLYFTKDERPDKGLRRVSRTLPLPQSVNDAYPLMLTDASCLDFRMSNCNMIIGTMLPTDLLPD